MQVDDGGEGVLTYLHEQCEGPEAGPVSDDVARYVAGECRVAGPRNDRGDLRGAARDGEGIR